MKENYSIKTLNSKELKAICAGELLPSTTSTTLTLVDIIGIIPKKNPIFGISIAKKGGGYQGGSEL